VSTSEDRASILKFMLEIKGFAVTASLSALEALDLLTNEQYHLLLCELPLTGIENLIDSARAIDEAMPSLALAGKLSQLPIGIHASAFIKATDYCPAYLLERVKVLTARKRGPLPRRIAPASDADSIEARRLAS
jgi:DNA-binding response OmpR family regulator